jgi:hypothetical protein
MIITTPKLMFRILYITYIERDKRTSAEEVGTYV